MGTHPGCVRFISHKWDFDLQKYVTKKRRASQSHPPCHCEQLIYVVLINCHYSPQRPSVFNCLTKRKPNVPESRRTQRRKLHFDDELSTITLNMVNKGNKPIVGECSSGTEAEKCTITCASRLASQHPKNYKRLAGGSDEEDNDHLAISTPHSHGFFWHGKVVAHMVDRSNGMSHSELTQFIREQ